MRSGFFDQFVMTFAVVEVTCAYTAGPLSSSYCSLLLYFAEIVLPWSSVICSTVGYGSTPIPLTMARRRDLSVGLGIRNHLGTLSLHTGSCAVFGTP